MHAVPETKYVAVGGADVAYQTIGDGSFDLLYCIGATQIDVQWEHPLMASFLQGLASFSRLILFDRRGFGASGRVGTSTPTWEGWAHDLGMVLDAAGSEEAAIFAEEEAGPIAMMFAAMRPERVRALVLGNTSARLLIAEDYPIGMPVESVDGWLQPLVEHWGTEDFMRRSYPRRAADADFTRWGAKMMRALATPREAAAQYRYIFESLDVREALPLIGVPTLVLHSPLLPTPPIEHGRYIAEHISGARLVEVPGDNGWFYAGDQRRVLDEVAEFHSHDVVAGGLEMRHDRVPAPRPGAEAVHETERCHRPERRPTEKVAIGVVERGQPPRLGIEFVEAGERNSKGYPTPGGCSPSGADHAYVHRSRAHSQRRRDRSDAPHRSCTCPRTNAPEDHVVRVPDRRQCGLAGRTDDVVRACMRRALRLEEDGLAFS